jgi:hypothetical protein
VFLVKKRYSVPFDILMAKKLISDRSLSVNPIVVDETSATLTNGTPSMHKKPEDTLGVFELPPMRLHSRMFSDFALKVIIAGSGNS